MTNINSLKRNSIFFYLAFFTAATQSIITQLFLKNYYPLNKELLLPLILVLGGIAYICGTVVSGKLLNTSPRVVILLMIFNAIAFISMLYVKSAFLYSIFYMIACFTCNFIFNFSDHYLIKIADGNIDKHVKTMIMFQMLAYTLSPVFFSMAYGRKILITSVILLIAVFTGYFLFKVFNDSKHGNVYQEVNYMKSQKISKDEKIFMLYVVIFLGLVSLTISMITYFISDYYKFTDFVFKTGVIMALMSIATAVTVILYKHATEEELNTNIAKIKYLVFRPRLQMLMICICLIVVVLLLLKLSNSFAYVAFIMLTIGIIYGVFSTTTRKFASKISLVSQRPKLLTTFNNMQSFAMILGYSISAIVWCINTILKGNFYVLLLVSISIILLLEVLLLIGWMRGREK